MSYAYETLELRISLLRASLNRRSRKRLTSLSCGESLIAVAFIYLLMMLSRVLISFSSSTYRFLVSYSLLNLLAASCSLVPFLLALSSSSVFSLSLSKSFSLIFSSSIYFSLIKACLACLLLSPSSCYFNLFSVLVMTVWLTGGLFAVDDGCV